MLINMRQLKDLHLKKFYLANPDRTLLGVLPDPAEKHGTFRLTPYSEITFSLERTADNAAMYDGLTKLGKVLVEDVGWFILEEPDVTSDGRTETKRCTMYSEEYELAGRMLRNFYLNTNDPGSVGSAEDGFVTFYDAERPSRSALHLVLEKFPDWTVGYVHPLLANRKAIGSFSVDEQDVYSFLTEDLAKAVSCLFLFDIRDHTVSAWPWEHFGETCDVYLSHDSLVEALDCSPVDESSMVTALFVEGADGLSIREVNCGFDELYDLSYYYDKMPKSLRQAWEDWLARKNERTEEYRQAILAYTDATDHAAALRNLLPEDTKSERPADYGIAALETKLSNVKGSISNYQEMGFDDPKHSRYPEYRKLLEKRDGILAEKNAKEARRQAFLDAAEAEKQKLEEIAAFVSWEQNFDEDQRKLLSHYLREGTYTNDTFLTTSLFTYEQTVQKKWELKEYALDRLSEMARPQYSVSTTLSNLAQLKAYESVLEKMSLGHKITVLFREFADIPLRLLSVALDFDNISSLSVEYSNGTRSRNGISDLAYLLDNDSGRGGGSSGRRSSSPGGSWSGDSGEYVTREELRSQLFNLSLQEKGGLSLSSQDIACLTDLIGGRFNTLDGNFLITKTLEADEASIGRLTTGILQSGYGEIERLVSEHASLKKLVNDTADIRSLLAGNAGIGELQAIRLTAANTVIDEAVIRDLIAAKISVGDLLAQTAVSEEIILISRDQKPVISFKDGTQQFYDAEGNVRIQIGQDGQGAFRFVLYDQTGSGILMDADGIRESAIADGLIKTDMLANKAVTEDKLDKSNIREWTDDDGGKVFDVSKLYYGGDRFEVSYSGVRKALDDTVSSVSAIALKVDENAGLISQKVSLSNLKSAVDTVYGADTVETLRDRLSEHTVSLSGITSRVSQMESSFGEEVGTLATKLSLLEQDAEGFQTTVESKFLAAGESLDAVRSMAVQNADRFSWLVDSGTSASDFTITDRLAELTADHINLKGLVTFQALDASLRQQIEDGNNAFAWTSANGGNAEALRSMVLKWTEGAVSDTTLIQGGWIAANTITADKLAAETITANELAANSVTANKLAAGSITADKLAANSVTAAKIATGAITADKIATGTITADKINVANLFSKNITATGTISGINLNGAKGSFIGDVTANTFRVNSQIQFYLQDYSKGYVPAIKIIPYDNTLNRQYYRLQVGAYETAIKTVDIVTHVLSGVHIPCDLSVSRNIEAKDIWLGAKGTYLSTALDRLSGVNGIRIKGGSIVRTVYEGTSYPLFSDSDMSAILGVSNSNVTNTIVFFENGDGAAQSVHIDGSTHLNNTWYATANRGMAAAPLRINWLAVYFG